jgi:hypothetical protein
MIRPSHLIGRAETKYKWHDKNKKRGFEMSVHVAPLDVGPVEAPVKACCAAKAAAAEPAVHQHHHPVSQPDVSAGAVLRPYRPIFIIAGAAAAGAVMLAAASPGMVAERLMGGFMGLFLLPLALLKLFDVSGFAASFARYDLLAKAWKPYALIYPFAELALALLFLSGLFPLATNIAAIAVGTLGTAGIVRTLSRGEQVRCACVGSVIDVPLGTVSIIENAGMAVMAALMLLM